MLFVEAKFFLFFGIVFALYWLTKSNDKRKWLVLIASYYFYGSWDWRFALMLAVISSADWYFAVRIAALNEIDSAQRRRRLFVTLSLAMNLSILAFFKYFNFFAESFLSLAGQFGLHLDDFTVKILLPVGVSFFTFQSLSYTIDVYRKDIEPVYSLRDYLMFSSFFPQLVAGPIVRPHYFVPQMASLRTLSNAEVRNYLLLFLLGYFKKMCLADNLSPYVDQVFHDPSQYSAFSGLLSVWLYAVQIFCDFSGYTDMAIAVAGLLGYKLVVNFDAPYLSASIQDFWRRWHISLSNWIRDYIYFSLGGRSENRLVTYRNLVVTMLAGGLWHGAAWTFVAWGGAHGIALVVQREFRRLFPPTSRFAFFKRATGWFLTINFVCCTWILFRADGFSVAIKVFHSYVMPFGGGPLSLPLWLAPIPLLLLAVQWSARRYRLSWRLEQLSAPAFSFLYGTFWAIAISLLPLGYRPFIYFQF